MQQIILNCTVITLNKRFLSIEILLHNVALFILKIQFPITHFRFPSFKIEIEESDFNFEIQALPSSSMSLKNNKVIIFQNLF